MVGFDKNTIKPNCSKEIEETPYIYQDKKKGWTKNEIKKGYPTGEKLKHGGA